MFAPYTTLEKCVGKEVRVRSGGEDYVGLLAGLYTSSGMSILVITTMRDGNVEQHIPVLGAVVTVKHDNPR